VASREFVSKRRQPAFAEAHLLDFIDDLVAHKLLAERIAGFPMRFNSTVTIRERVDFVAHGQPAILHHRRKLAAPWIDFEGGLPHENAGP